MTPVRIVHQTVPVTPFFSIQVFAQVLSYAEVFSGRGSCRENQAYFSIQHQILHVKVHSSITWRLEDGLW